MRRQGSKTPKTIYYQEGASVTTVIIPTGPSSLPSLPFHLCSQLIWVPWWWWFVCVCVCVHGIFIIICPVNIELEGCCHCCHCGCWCYWCWCLFISPHSLSLFLPSHRLLQCTIVYHYLPTISALFFKGRSSKGDLVSSLGLFQEALPQYRVAAPQPLYFGPDLIR